MHECHGRCSSPDTAFRTDIKYRHLIAHGIDYLVCQRDLPRIVMVEMSERRFLRKHILVVVLVNLVLCICTSVIVD